jgi:2Fe-2S ferredoxin
MSKLIVTDRLGARHEIAAAPGEPLMFILRDHAKLPVEGLCGGCAACGTCHVYVDEAWVERLPPREAAEQDMLAQLYHFDTRKSRLSCQIRVSPDVDGLALRLAPEE